MGVDRELLSRSSAFQYSLREALIGETERAIPPGARNNAVFAYCKIALEHGAGIQTLFGDDNPIAALALVRSQYEGVLRGSWIRYAAADVWLEKFSSPPESNEGRESAVFPHVHAMLDQLQNSQAESALHTSLASLKAKAWNTLHSYTHGGLLPMIRALEGFEPELLAWMLRTSNSLSYVAAQLLAFVANDPQCNHRLLAIRNEMADCMHS